MKFVTVNLAMNVSRAGIPGKPDPGGPVECSCSDGGSCNDGGSYICTAGTVGCEAGLSCAGTSYTHQNCGGGSIVEMPGLDVSMSIRASELSLLRSELQRMVMQFSAQKA